VAPIYCFSIVLAGIGWVPQGLTENQRRLLYLLSLYSHPAESSSEKEKWVRKPSILVLLYEGIVAQVLDYDYAPSSEIVESRRMYFNISQVRLCTRCAPYQLATAFSTLLE
jgi:hypothetical protein